jgi:hypothetical protein
MPRKKRPLVFVVTSTGGDVAVFDDWSKAWLYAVSLFNDEEDIEDYDNIRATKKNDQLHVELKSDYKKVCIDRREVY